MRDDIKGMEDIIENSTSCSANLVRFGFGMGERPDMIRWIKLLQSHHQVMCGFELGRKWKRRSWMINRKAARMAYASHWKEEILEPNTVLDP